MLARAGFACLFAACLGLADDSRAAAPSAGSTIDNTARATYFDNDRGFNTLQLSNPVAAAVQAQERTDLTAAPAVTRPAGSTASFAHTLTNTGNSSSRYELRFANAAGDDLDLINLALVWDRNGNGVADSGEPVLADGAQVGPLAPGQTMALVLTGQMPVNAAAAQTARVTLAATSTLQTQSARITDVVSAGTGAALRLVKSASALSPLPGQAVAFTITASNLGDRAAQGVPVQVDGAAQTLLLLRDTVPANTTFAAFGAAGNARALVHRLGQPEHAYDSVLPADLRQVDAVAFGWTEMLAPSASLARSFSVRIHDNAGGEIVNVAQMLFYGGVQASNAVRLALAARAPTLALYRDAGYTQPAAALALGAPLYAALDAARCNTDPLRAEQVALRVRSRLGQDAETFLASETAPNSGVFRIEPRVPTADAAASRVTPGDGIVGVRSNDEITIDSAACIGEGVSAKLRVDPFGIVFDSKTNAPLAGARVELVHADAQSGVVPLAVITGADGVYRLPTVAAGAWRLVVTPPARYLFPSSLADDLLPADRQVAASAAHGVAFNIGSDAAPLSTDVPLDAIESTDLRVEKDRKSVV